MKSIKTFLTASALLVTTRNWSYKLMPKFSLDLQLFDNLSITSSTVLK